MAPRVGEAEFEKVMIDVHTGGLLSGIYLAHLLAAPVPDCLMLDHNDQMAPRERDMRSLNLNILIHILRC